MEFISEVALPLLLLGGVALGLMRILSFSGEHAKNAGTLVAGCILVFVGLFALQPYLPRDDLTWAIFCSAYVSFFVETAFGPVYHLVFGLAERSQKRQDERLAEAAQREHESWCT